MSAPGSDADLPAGVCVCGRGIPQGSPSDWACGETCQSAWLMHQVNPEYPHPRDIREAFDTVIDVYSCTLCRPNYPHPKDFLATVLGRP